MKFPMLAVALAVALAACGDQPPQPRVSSPPAASDATPAPAPSTAPSATPSTTPSAPAAGGATGIEERKEGANPVQQQVDPKEREQRRDFQHPREGAGPTSPETQPKN
jgi:hypothetical protein